MAESTKVDITKKKNGKPKIIRWRGVMGRSTRMFRIIVALLLIVTGIALTYTQLGFVGVELPDGTVGYIVSLLPIVALGALLLGTFSGMAIGFVTGGVLCLHAQMLPLDHYELSFVTPLTSVVMFTVTGLLLGLSFAIALRRNPSQLRRTIYLLLICIVVSLLYSLGFVFNVVLQLTVDAISAFGTSLTQEALNDMVQRAALGLGSIDVQHWGTALAMAVLCIAGDYLTRKALARTGALGLRSVFAAWLGVVIALAFMMTSAISFGVTTTDELWDAAQDMQNDATYLCNQITSDEARAASFVRFAEQANIDASKLSNEAVDNLYQSMSRDDLLNGYDPKEHGTVIISSADMLIASNEEGYKPYESLEDQVGTDVTSAISDSLESGSMTRFVYGVADTVHEGDAKSLNTVSSKPHIAYLYAKEAITKSANGTEYSTTVAVMQSSDKVFEKRPSVLSWMFLSSFVLLLVVFAIVFQLLNRFVARRIDEENSALAAVTAGDLDARAQAAGTREFESLSTGINTTVDKLKSLIAEAESRMDAELATAKAIQEAALPRIFPPYPDITKFDVYASMNAAKQVGGDFYDFFLMGDDCGPTSGKVAFIVADVSGKGVPAALFMMKAKALLRDYVGSGLELGEAVGEANRQLIDGNNAGMFVTAWVGVLDYGTGHVDFVNAGHNPPLLWQREGGWRWLREKSGVPLGLFELPYDAFEVQCAAGDMFLLYTDGVTEAFDVDENLYGEERLLAVAQNGSLDHPRELLEEVRADVASFATGAEQSDDITVLTLEVGVPPEVTATLEVPARVENLDRVNTFLHSELNARLCPQRVQSQLDIAVEELFVNVCHYAYPDATPEQPGSVRIQRTYCAEPASITVDIIDEGIPYDPLAKPDAVTPDDIADVPIGGLGILMAKKCTDEMYYERADDCNIVTIVKKW